MHKTLICGILLNIFFQKSFSQQADSLLFNKQEPLYLNESVEPVKFKVAPLIISAVLIGYGFVAVHDNGALKQLDLNTKDELQEDHPLFAAHVDDYVQFAPALAVYGLNLAGIKGKHNLADATFLYATSAAIMGVSTHFVKQAEHRLRPNGSAYNSFPSGHTASAFAAAEFLKQEYKDISRWYGYAGYFVATATGTLRMYNNKHWFSDVVAGAGFGIASTKISYFIYPYIRRLFAEKKTQAFAVMPFHQEDINGLIFYGRF